MNSTATRLTVLAVLIAVVACGSINLMLFGRLFAPYVFSEPPISAHAPGRDQAKLPKLPTEVSGTVLLAESDLVAFDLPTLKESVAWKRPGQPHLHSIAGPDRRGRVAMVINDMMGERHWLVVKDQKTGTETKLFERRGDALWGDISRNIKFVSETLAQSSDTGQIALGVDLGDFQIHNPEALVNRGPLEIWDIATKKSRRPGVDITDCGFDWFPDGKRLAIVELVDPAAAPAVPSQPDSFMKSFKSANAIPVITILDTKTGTKTRLHQGWQPVVSDDGKTILATDYEFNVRLIDVATKRSRSVVLPDFYGVVVAVKNSDSAIYVAKQSPGREKLSQHNSPLVGPKDLPRVVYAKFGAKAPQTIIEYVDPRWQVSFGPGRAKK